MKNSLDNIILEIDGAKGEDHITKSLQNEWGNYDIYHVNNVPEVSNISFYEKLARKLGIITACRPVNNKSKVFEESRDIRPDSSVYHFYAARTRQPLHTDHAHYPSENSPDWVFMYCLEPSEFGGTTRVISTKQLKKIMTKYNSALLKKLAIDASYKYIGESGDIIHCKPIMSGDVINWNYWQIKPEFNTEETMEVREEFFRFLEDVIVAGCIYDFSKVWTKGDLLIFNDKKTLHGRDAFLGDRWLKSFSLFN